MAARGSSARLRMKGKPERNQYASANGSFVATGPDRFVYAYTKWDVPDPWGRPRQAVIAQEFVVSNQ